MTVEPPNAQPVQAGSSRARTVLIVAIALLLALLIGLVIVFYNLLKPAGLPETAGGGEDALTWVRSMYGFGPAADEQLFAPISVAIAPNGDVWAADQTRARIMVFRSDGTFKRLIHTGGGGTAKGQFQRPESLAFDADGNAWIADTQAGKIIALTQDGRFIRELPAEAQARGVAVDGDKVYMLDLGKVIVFDRNTGKKITSWGVRGAAPGQIDAYQGIVAKDGIVYVADSFNKRLQAFQDDGKLLWVVPEGSATREGPGSRKGTGSDSSASEAVPDHRWDLPQDLVFDARGRLVVIDAFQFELAAVDPKTGKVQAKYGDFGTADGQFFYPTSIAYDPARDWFAVADTQNNRIQIVRIPNSGGGAGSGVWRALSSPYRYLAIPLGLLLIAIALAVWAVWRMMRKNRAAETPLAE
ncbi:MAG: hypothetical protein FDZ75_03570 [Actinobacteria bacterium]|nr:MAG: hypothetical protein FDZ75_03570 [Actinomycetota bacterium]